jgi:hypothetical protein
MLYELGILFNVDEAVESDHRKEAWKLFMRVCDPKRLAGSTLYEGETTDPLSQLENAFCIAVQNLDERVIAYVKAAFIHCNELGLMPKGQRFLERGVTLRFTLDIRARIDKEGRFRSWDGSSVRLDERLCQETGWGFGETARALSIA